MDESVQVSFAGYPPPVRDFSVQASWGGTPQEVLKVEKPALFAFSLPKHGVGLDARVHGTPSKTVESCFVRKLWGDARKDDHLPPR